MSDALNLSESLVSFARSTGVVPGSLAPIARESFVCDGVRLRYLDWGGSPKRTVIFLHGGGLTARTWDVTCLALRARFRCVALDLRGHGESDWADDADYRLERYATDVAGLVEHLDLDDPVVVGNSLGGQTALLYSAENSATRGLVLVDVGPEPDRRASAQIIRSLDAPQEFPDLDAAVRRAVVMNPRRHPDVLRESLPHNLRQLDNGNLTWRYDSRAFSALSEEVLSTRTGLLWDAVPSVSCPVLIVRGEASRVFSEEQAAILADRLPRAERTTVPDAGHTTQGDNPSEFVAAIEPFLERAMCLPG